MEDPAVRTAAAKKTTVENKYKECMDYFDSRGESAEEDRIQFMLEVCPIYLRYTMAVETERCKKKRKYAKGGIVATPIGDGWVLVKTPGKESTMPIREAIEKGYRIGEDPNAKREDKSALRGGIYDEFIAALQRMPFIPDHIIGAHSSSLDKILYGFCPSCNVNMVEDSAKADLVCTKCAMTVPAANNGIEACPYGTSVNTADYCYKRINHLNECIAQFHARERSTIPDDVVAAVDKEFKKMRVVDRENINAKNVRKVLRKLRMPRYFEHSVQITHILNGTPPPTMSLEQEERLRNMFRSIQKPFEDICPKNRKNFLNYSYTLHKMCQLQGYDEFLDHFPLLKSKEKLWGQDAMWKGICAKLNWQFIPST